MLGEIWSSLGETWAKWCLIWKNASDINWNEIPLFCFRGHFLWSFFRAISGKFGQKSFAPPKFCLLLHLSQRIYQLAIYRTEPLCQWITQVRTTCLLVAETPLIPSFSSK